MFKDFSSVRMPVARYFTSVRSVTIWTQPKKPFVGGGFLSKRLVNAQPGDRITIRAPKEVGHDAFVKIARPPKTKGGNYYAYASGWVRYGVYENLRVFFDGGNVKEVRKRSRAKDDADENVYLKVSPHGRKTKVAVERQVKKRMRQPNGVSRVKIAEALHKPAFEVRAILSRLAKAGMQITKL
jgi:hypothetical protein